MRKLCVHIITSSAHWRQGMEGNDSFFCEGTLGRAPNTGFSDPSVFYMNDEITRTIHLSVLGNVVVHVRRCTCGLRQLGIDVPKALSNHPTTRSRLWTAQYGVSADPINTTLSERALTVS